MNSITDLKKKSIAELLNPVNNLVYIMQTKLSQKIKKYQHINRVIHYKTVYNQGFWVVIHRFTYKIDKL